jgi:tetraacyldisaccharide 4'-kinase
MDVVVVNGPDTANVRNAQSMALEGRVFRNVADPARSCEAGALRGKRLHAVAGIGNPARFFSALGQLGLRFEAHPFPDHHRFDARDLEFPDADAILMTEKDAIKCARFARGEFWMLPVDARVAPQLGQLVLDKLKAAHGSQAA